MVRGREPLFYLPHVDNLSFHHNLGGGSHRKKILVWVYYYYFKIFIYLFTFYFYFLIKKNFFWLHCTALWDLSSPTSIERGPLQWKHRVLTTEPPGNSLLLLFYSQSFHEDHFLLLQWKNIALFIMFFIPSGIWQGRAFRVYSAACEIGSRMGPLLNICKSVYSS